MDIVRKHSSHDYSVIHELPPENITAGHFLHVITQDGRSLRAEGVIPSSPGVRVRAAQREISHDFNTDWILHYQKPGTAPGKIQNIVHASHLIPREFGGSGNTYNLVALPKKVNTEQIPAFERSLWLETELDPIYLQVFVCYRKEQRIAHDILYRPYRWENGKAVKPMVPMRFSVLH